MPKSICDHKLRFSDTFCLNCWWQTTSPISVKENKVYWKYYGSIVTGGIGIIFAVLMLHAGIVVLPFVYSGAPAFLIGLGKIFYLLAFSAAAGSIGWYCGKIIDGIKTKRLTCEQIGTLLGCCFGLSIALALVLCGAVVPIPFIMGNAILLGWQFLPAVGFIIASTAIYTTLGNFIFRLIDYWRAEKSLFPLDEAKQIEPKSYWKYYGSIAIGSLGFIFSLILLHAGIASIPFIGIGSFIPYWLGAILFSATFTATAGGIGWYNGKILDAVKAKRLSFEQIGTIGGCILGITLAAIMIGIGASVPIPFVMASVIAAGWSFLPAATFIIASAALCGGIGTFVFRFIDYCVSEKNVFDWLPNSIETDTYQRLNSTLNSEKSLNELQLNASKDSSVMPNTVSREAQMSPPLPNFTSQPLNHEQFNSGATLTPTLLFNKD